MKKNQYTSISEFLDYEIYPDIDLVKALSKYQPEDQQFAVRLKCPRCKKRTAVIEKGKSFMICSSDVGCGLRRTIVELMAHPKSPRGDVYKNIIRKMMELTGKSIPENLYGQPGAPNKPKRREKKAPIILESYEEYLARGGVPRIY